MERAIARDVAQHFSGITSLVFANTRGQVEGYADLCRVLMPNNEVLVHHGSLARDIREDAEERLKNGSKAKAITAFCSSTLELGIDLGDVAAVGQIGAPPSVASLKQRLGRSGRGEDQTRVLRVYLELQESSADDDVFDRLHLPLVQTIAATELMLEGWVEPASQASCDLSTLTQQIISVIAQTGGTDAAFLYRTLCQEGAFSKVEPALFAQLLRCLGDQEKDVIEQTPTGELILGLRGEKLRKSRDFYAVFLTPEEYAVLHDGQLLGHLPVYWAPPTGEHLLFAGRRWQVVSVEEERHQIYVRPASGKKKPQFFGESAEVHPKLRQKMRDVLHSPQKYAYLDKIASQSLVEARREAERLYGKVLLPMGQGSTALLLWTGDRLALSIHLLLMAAGAKIKGGGDSSGVAIIYRHCEDELQSFMAKAAAMVVNGEELAQLLPNKQRRKYDWLLSDDLLEVSFAQDWLDVAGAQHLLTELSTSHS